jgi:hypothetical protein
MITMVDLSPEPVTVKDAVTTASILTHVKNNRIEYLLLVGLLHLLGISDRVFTHAAGMC